MKRTRRLVISAILLMAIIFLFVYFGRTGEQPQPTLASLGDVRMPEHYSEYLATHPEPVFHDDRIVFPHTAFDLDPGEENSIEDDYYAWRDPSGIRLHFDVEKAGHYAVYFDYRTDGDSHLPINLSVYLDGAAEPPYYEASQIVLDSLWQETEEPGTDRYGNDVNVLQEPYYTWQNLPLTDARDFYSDGLTFYFDEGAHSIEFYKGSGEILLKEITLKSLEERIDYDQYLTLHQTMNREHSYRIEAEEATYKNSSTIIRGINRDPLVEPFSMTRLKLNVLGTDSFDEPGDAASYLLPIEEAGLYHITLKVNVNEVNKTVYRTIRINGDIPFSEAKHIPISYQRGWQNVTLSSPEGTPFLFWLEPGDVLTVEVDGTLFSAAYEHLKMIADEITALGLDVVKLTKNNTDRGIDWDMKSFFPDLERTLQTWIEELETIDETLNGLYGFSRDAQINRDLKAAAEKLERVAADVDELPRRLTLLSTGSSSALQMIANQLDQVVRQPMVFDALFVHGVDSDPPDPTPSLWQKTRVFFARFFQSFLDPAYDTSSSTGELEVWVNRPRQYVDLIQRITDANFTTETGKNVKISLISDDSKLLLANSAGQQPDVAMGVSAWIPIEYGMRGMLYDLSSAPGFQETISVYNPEQLIPMVYDEKLYGLPETENFYVLFYRRDIVIDQLGLEVPDTWEDVLDMLPVLQRYGMSFYVTLSSMSAQKSFDSTAPFIYQHGGKIYQKDGFGAAIDDENTIRALNFMTDLYREHAIPDQIPSFFNSFRYQTIPIGIGDFGMYLQLMNAAADISGLWEIALVPGVEREIENPTGENETIIDRSMPGAQQAAVIFDASTRKEDAWEFLSWWMRTETQILFYETMLNTLGTRYLWNSANLEAFESFRWNEGHKEIILEQWSHLKEVPRIPGSYIIEREISNTWNKVVYDDANLRAGVSDAMIKIDRELTRKMIEFGYLDQQQNRIRPFIVPTREDILRWYDDDRE